MLRSMDHSTTASRRVHPSLVAVFLLALFSLPRTSAIVQPGRSAGLDSFLGGKLFKGSKVVRSLNETSKITIVPPQSGRMFVLKVNSLTKYQVTLAATTTELAFGNATEGTKDFIDWRTEAQCDKAPLLAVAYREDQLPKGIFPPMNLAKTAPSNSYKQLISELSRDCESDVLDEAAAADSAASDGSYTYDDAYDAYAAANPGTGGVSLLSAGSENSSTWESFMVLGQQVEALINASKPGMRPMLPWAAETTQTFLQQAYGDSVYSARPQIAAAKQSYDAASEQYVLSPTDAALQKLQNTQLNFICNLLQAELQNPVLNITLSHEPLLKECAPEGSRVFVFVYNCLVPEQIATGTAAGYTTNPELMVSVKVDTLDDSAEDACFNAVDRFVWYLNWTTVIIGGVVAVSFTVLFEVGPTLKKKVFGRGASPNSHSSSSRGPRSWWRLVVGAMRTINSPSGYSRGYTILITTTASLLVAAIVWQPSVEANAQHDHAWFDNPVGPTKQDVSQNRAADIIYYLKVMGISALIGYSVKLALLANIGAPDPGSTGVVVSPRVWKRQVVISVAGLVMLSLMVLSNASYMLNQSRAWVYQLPYMYLVIILILHYIASLVMFIIYTFVRPPPLTSSSYHMLTADPKGASSQEDNAWKSETGKPMAPAAGDKRTGPIHWLTSLPGRVYRLVSEEEHLRYSAWILIPVWLSACLMIFWYLMGISRSDVIVSCIESPKNCVGGRLQTWIGVADALLDTDTVNQGMQVLRALDEQNLRTGIQLLQNVSSVFDPSSTDATELAVLQNLQNTMQKMADISNATQRVYQPYLSRIGPKIDNWKADAEKAYYAGRLAGYTLAIIFAAASLFNILRTFKRILLHRYLMTLKPQQQDELIQELKEVGSIEGGALARAMTRLRGHDWEYGSPGPTSGLGVVSEKRSAQLPAHLGPYPYTDNNAAQNTSSNLYPGSAGMVSVGAGNPTGGVVQYPCAQQGVSTVAQADLGIYPYPAAYTPANPAAVPGDVPYFTNSYNSDSSSPIPHKPQQQQFIYSDTYKDPDQAEAAAVAALKTATSAASQLADQLPRSTLDLRVGSSASNRRGDAADGAADGTASDRVEEADVDRGASTEIMYTIQMLEDDMSLYGIGASVALFGVLVSTMWVQIRIVGFIFTMVATILFHPAFWTHVMNRWWVSIVSVIGLVLFNMLVIKRFIGSKLLSDGTSIKHRGAWMTFYLMCQLAFLVVGILYATWRVVWALIVMLLYSVACLDRSILIICKFLDGSYIAFVTSVKLEAAWYQISQQKVDEQNNQRQGEAPDTKDPESLQQ